MIFSGRLIEANSFIGNGFGQLNDDRVVMAENRGPPSPREARAWCVINSFYSGALCTFEHQTCPMNPLEKEKVQGFSVDVKGFILASLFFFPLSAFPCSEPLVHPNVRLASLTRRFGRTVTVPSLTVYNTTDHPRIDPHTCSPPAFCLWKNF